MKSRTVLFLLLSASILSSCASTKELDGSSQWTLELNKGACMDVCDAYQITIQSDRTYQYKGIHNVKHIGEKTGKLSEKSFTQLNTLLETIDWNDFESEYGSAGTAAQRKELLFKSESHSDTIIYYRLEPQKIRELELFIDQLIDLDDL